MARAPVLQDIEAAPEADRLEPFPHPRSTLVLHGHADAEAGLARMFASGRMHHAWLLTGPPGIGKATLAYRFARHVLAEPFERDPFGDSLAIDPATVAARQVEALSHPGLLLIRRQWNTKDKRFGQSISVDDVRRLKGFLTLTADVGRWRVVIVDPVDDLNTNAANALLKALEEPPPSTVFLMTCSEPGRLLPTIRSRCRTLDLDRLDRDALEKAADAALTAAGQPPPVPAQRGILARLAEGSVRRYLALAATDGLKLHDRLRRQLERLPTVDWGEIHQLSDELSANAAAVRYEQFFELLLDTLARIVRAGAGASRDAEDAGLAARVLSTGGIEAAARLWHDIVRDKADCDSLNLDRKQLVLSVFQRLEALRGASASR